jgi:hypothetical protein
VTVVPFRVRLEPVPPVVDVKVVSVMPPWAHLVALGAKPSLCQGFAPLHRGWVALHVPEAVPNWAEALFAADPFARALGHGGAPWLRARGCVVGVARLVMVHTRGRRDDLWAANRKYGDYKPGSWLWEFDQFRVLPDPVPLAGRVGIRDLDSDSLCKVLVQLGPDELESLPEAKQ